MGKTQYDRHFRKVNQSINRIFDKTEAYLWCLVSTIEISKYARYGGMSRKNFNAFSSHFIATPSSFNTLLCSFTALPHPLTHPHHPLALFHQLLTLTRRTLTPPPPPKSPSIYLHRHLTPICHAKMLPCLPSTHSIAFIYIRFCSWNYRSCWHQTCPPIDPFPSFSRRPLPLQRISFTFYHISITFYHLSVALYRVSATFNAFYWPSTFSRGPLVPLCQPLTPFHRH